MSAIIEVSHITKRYGKETVLDDVSLSFEEGKIHGIIGRNGSGKTMLFKTICGFVKPTEGKVTVRGKQVGKDVDFPKDVGLIIETPGFLPYFSGFKNLQLLASLTGKIGDEGVRVAMERVGLDPKMKKSVRKYSLGMNQRLGIAQAIMADPGILVLDEPMNGLDNQGVADMRSLFLKLKEEGKTILLASHNREDIAALCDTVTEMDRGKVIARSGFDEAPKEEPEGPPA